MNAAEPELVLTIGNKNYSSWSLRAYLVLHATGAPFREVVIPLDQPTSRAELRKANPAARVPVLRDGDLVIWDSLAIAEYLHERFPEARLWPDAVRARARARSVSAEMHSGFAGLRGAMPMDIRGRHPRRGRTPAALADVSRVLEIWRDCRRAAPVDEGPFLFGAFTIADAMFAPVATRLVTYDVDLDDVCQAYVDALHDHPGMAAWRAAAEAEPWTITYDLA
jgi:glutathione S-transferase